MPNASVRIGLRTFELFNEGRIDELMELTHPEVVLATDRAWPDGGTYRGRAGFRRFVDQFLEAFGGIHFERDEEPEEIGEAALLSGRWVGEGATSGIEAVSFQVSVIFLAREEQLADAHFFFSEDAARDYAGTVS